MSLKPLYLKNWLMKLPEDTVNRLRMINSSAGSSHHIILALTYGLYDRHIRKINRIISSLLIARLKAKRAGKTLVVARINHIMGEVHAAIDQLTGTDSAKHTSPNPACSRPAQSKVAG